MRGGYPDVVVLEGPQDAWVAITAFAPFEDLHSLGRNIYRRAIVGYEGIGILDAPEAELALCAIRSLAELNSSNVKAPLWVTDHYNAIRNPVSRRDHLRYSDKALVMLQGYVPNPNAVDNEYAAFAELDLLVERRPIRRFFNGNRTPRTKN